MFNKSLNQRELKFLKPFFPNDSLVLNSKSLLTILDSSLEMRQRLVQRIPRIQICFYKKITIELAQAGYFEKAVKTTRRLSELFQSLQLHFALYKEALQRENFKLCAYLASFVTHHALDGELEWFSIDLLDRGFPTHSLLFASKIRKLSVKTPLIEKVMSHFFAGDLTENIRSIDTLCHPIEIVKICKIVLAPCIKKQTFEHTEAVFFCARRALTGSHQAVDSYHHSQLFHEYPSFERFLMLVSC